MLRNNIQKIIEASIPAEEKAVMILLYLDFHESLGLNGNGWYDEDEIMLQAIELYVEEDSVRERLQNILQ